MSIYASIIGIIICIINITLLKKSLPKYRFRMLYIIIFFLIFPISCTNKYSIYNYINIKFWRKNQFNFDINNNNNNNFILQDMTIDNRVNSMQNYIVIIWLIISIILILFKIFCYMKLYKEGNEIKDKNLLKLFQRCKNECGIKKDIKLCISKNVTIPSIYGLGNIKIFIPEDLLCIDKIKLKNIIKHEMYHYKRRDNILNYFLIFLKSVYWFNPVVGILLKIVKENMEYSTDELVINNMKKEEYKDYCKTILGVSTHNYELLEYVVGFINGKEEIEKRVDNILEKESYYNHKNVKMILYIIIFFVLFIFLSPVEKQCSDYKIYLETSSNNEACLYPKNLLSENIISLKVGEYIIFNNNKDIKFRSLNNNDGSIEMWSMIAYTEKGEYCYEIENESNDNYYYLKVIVE